MLGRHGVGRNQPAQTPAGQVEGLGVVLVNRRHHH